MKLDIESQKEDSDGNVHVVPLDREHIEDESCWCEPELAKDYTETGGVKVYVHRKIQ